MVPIFKKGNRQDPANYRQISITQILSKVLESIVRDQLMDHVSSTGQLTDAQHGFLPKLSCTSQLLATLDDWTQCIESGEPVDCAYLYFQKAFDSVPHQRLIKKLHDMGVHGELLSWIKAFLTAEVSS